MITLVLGGTRSGKSEAGEAIAARSAAPVTYVATGRATDDAMAERIAAHRRRRPTAWRTVDVPGPAGEDLPAVLAACPGTALVDSLGTWVAFTEGLVVDVEGLCAALAGRPGDTVVVSEEVGLGVHPPTDVGRRFADALGTLNRAVADVADDVFLVVAGRLLPLERP